MQGGFTQEDQLGFKRRIFTSQHEHLSDLEAADLFTHLLTEKQEAVSGKKRL